MNEPQRTGQRSPWVMVGLCLIGFVFLALGMRGCWIQPPWADGWGFHRSFFFPFYGLLSLWGVIQVGLAIWVGVDAHRKGLNGFLWGLLVLFTHIVGLIVYLLVSPTLVRNGSLSPLVAPASAPPAAGPTVPSGEESQCSGCGAAVESGFKVCPYCGGSLRCGQCQQPIRSGWKVCPNCAAPIPGATD